MLRELFVKDFAWKLLALALAVAIWLTVKGFSGDSGNEKERTFTDLPAQIVSGTTDVRTFGVNPDVVQVTVKARSDIVRALKEQEIRVFVDGTTTGPTRTFRRRVEVSTPTRVTVVKVDPPEVEVVVPPRPSTTAPPARP